MRHGRTVDAGSLVERARFRTARRCASSAPSARRSPRSSARAFRPLRRGATMIYGATEACGAARRGTARTVLLPRFSWERPCRERRSTCSTTGSSRSARAGGRDLHRRSAGTRLMGVRTSLRRISSRIRSPGGPERGCTGTAGSATTCRTATSGSSAARTISSSAPAFASSRWRSKAPLAPPGVAQRRDRARGRHRRRAARCLPDDPERRRGVERGAATLPRDRLLHMIPGVFVTLAAMPSTGNGKISRDALPDPGICARGSMRRSRRRHRRWRSRWAASGRGCSGSTGSGLRDDFLNSGHSLSAARVISSVVQAFALDLQLKALFDAPTVAAMAKVIERTRGAARWTACCSEHASMPPPLIEQPTEGCCGEDVRPVSATSRMASCGSRAALGSDDDRRHRAARDRRVQVAVDEEMRRAHRAYARATSCVSSGRKERSWRGARRRPSCCGRSRRIATTSLFHGDGTTRAPKLVMSATILSITALTLGQ